MMKSTDFWDATPLTGISEESTAHVLKNDDMQEK
jgi:hypothetical protein